MLIICSVVELKYAASVTLAPLAIPTEGSPAGCQQSPAVTVDPLSLTASKDGRAIYRASLGVQWYMYNPEWHRMQQEHSSQYAVVSWSNLYQA